MELSDQLLTVAALFPVKNPGTHCIGGWVGPRADLEAVEKIIPGIYRKSNPDIPACRPRLPTELSRHVPHVYLEAVEKRKIPGIYRKSNPDIPTYKPLLPTELSRHVPHVHLEI
jgi:hypothetical protein